MFALRSFLVPIVSSSLLIACESKPTVGGPTTTASAVATTTPSGSGATKVAGTASASATNATGSASGTTAASAGAVAAAPGAASAWDATYKSAAGTLYVPAEKDWKGFRFRGEESAAGIGDGTMKLSVDAQGKVTGEGEGALGKFTVSGSLRDNAVTATLTASDGAAFYGTLQGTRNGDALTGTMKLSNDKATLVREASFTGKLRS
jgi:hypothetical protein